MWKLLVLGDSRSSEMRPLSDQIAVIAKGYERREAAVVETALQFREDEWFPDLAIVFQSWPDEFLHRDVTGLLSTFPLTRLVCCYGFWCESDGRNRDVWPPATRIAVRAALPRIRRELEILENRLAALPMTAGREEVFAFDCPGELSPQNQGPAIGIVSSDVSLRIWLRDLLEAAGYRTCTDESKLSDVAAVVWDVDPLTDDVANRIRQFTSSHAGIPAVALKNGASAEDAASFIDFGIESTVPKLASHELLLEVLHRRLREAHSEPSPLKASRERQRPESPV